MNLKSPSWQFKLLLIILLILLPYTHPSGSLVMIFLLIAMELARIAHDKRYKRSWSKISVNPILISSITFFMWMSSFAMFGAHLSSLHVSIFEPYKARWAVDLTETAFSENISPIYGKIHAYLALRNA